MFEFMLVVRAIGLILSLSLLYEISRVAPLYQSFSVTLLVAFAIALASFGFAFPYPFNPLWHSKPFILLAQFKIAEKIIRSQISWLESLNGFPKGWYVSDTTYDALRVRLAYCLHRQNKVQEAEDVFRNVNVNRYLRLWRSKPMLTDVSLAPELARYQKITAQQVTASNKIQESIQCIFLVSMYVAAVWFIVAFYPLSNPNLTELYLRSSVEWPTDEFLVEFCLKCGKFEAAKSKVAFLLARDPAIEPGEVETIRRDGAHACFGLGDDKEAVDYLKHCQGNSPSQDKVIARELALAQALVALPGSSNELHSVIKEIGNCGIPSNVLRSIAQRIKGTCLPCASEMRELADSLDRGGYLQAFLQVSFLLFLWLTPPFMQEKVMGISSSVKDN